MGIFEVLLTFSSAALPKLGFESPGEVKELRIGCPLSQLHLISERKEQGRARSSSEKHLPAFCCRKG